MVPVCARGAGAAPAATGPGGLSLAFGKPGPASVSQGPQAVNAAMPFVCGPSCPVVMRAADGTLAEKILPVISLIC